MFAIKILSQLCLGYQFVNLAQVQYFVEGGN